MNIRLVSAMALVATTLAATPLSAAPPPPALANDAASDSANQAVVEGLYRAFGAGDGATIAGLLAPDLVWIEAENGPYADRNPYNGPAAVFEGLFARLGAEYEGFAVNPVTFVSSGDRVVALGRYTGTNRATGEALDAQFAHVFTVSNGKVTRFQQYTDTAQWMDVTTPD